MNTSNPRQLGRTQGRLLHDRLTEAGIPDGLYSRIVATMPAVVQEAQATGSSLVPMFRATASQDALCFACARLAVKGGMMFTKRVIGLIRVPDKNAWGEFTEGVLEYATDSMGHPATRGRIVEDINDHENAVGRLCRQYPPEAAQVLLDATQQIESMVSEVLSDLDGPLGGTSRTPMFALLKFLALFLFGLGATLVIGLTYPVFLVTTIVLGIVGFGMGKSTKVLLNPREVPLSPMVTLSYHEFDTWARQNDLRRTAPAFFSRTDVHWTEKLSMLFSGSGASGHCFEPSRSTTKLLFADLSLGAFILFPAIHEAFGSLDSRGSLFFQFMCGLALGQVAGRATGGFYRWLRAKM